MTNKRCLIYETLGKVTNLQVSESAAPQGMMRLEGVFGVCGVKNQNNRIYDKENYAKMVESLQQVIKEDNGCPGELEHPNSMNINLENVSHKIEKIQMNEDGTITGTILLLNTPKGQIAQAIVEGGLPLYISSRGAGTITNESGISHVTLSTIKTYDLVGTPGFSQAKLNLLKKNQTLECLNESAEEGNIMYAIVEGEDDLLGDDSDKDKKDEPKEEPKDEPKDNKKEEKKDNNKNNDKKVDMNELKDAIDKLTAKVESLEAGLHVAQESLNEVKDIQPTNYDAIQKWVTEEFWPNYKDQISEGLTQEEVEEMIQTKFDESLNSMAEGIQNWVVEEFEFKIGLLKNLIQKYKTGLLKNLLQKYKTGYVKNLLQKYKIGLLKSIHQKFKTGLQKSIHQKFRTGLQKNILQKYKIGLLKNSLLL